MQIALGDRHAGTRGEVLTACRNIIDAQGQAAIPVVLPLLEDYLIAANSATGSDIVRESVVVLLGSLAKHLDKTDPKIPGIVDTLLSTLSTPSQLVQEVVASCLPPLMPIVKVGSLVCMYTIYLILLNFKILCMCT